jgi:hypothetical protein
MWIPSFYPSPAKAQPKTIRDTPHGAGTLCEDLYSSNKQAKNDGADCIARQKKRLLPSGCIPNVLV